MSLSEQLGYLMAVYVLTWLSILVVLGLLPAAKRVMWSIREKANE